MYNEGVKGTHNTKETKMKKVIKIAANQAAAEQMRAKAKAAGVRMCYEVDARTGKCIVIFLS